MELAAKLVLVIVIAWLSDRRTSRPTATPLALAPPPSDSDGIALGGLPDLHHIRRVPGSLATSAQARRMDEHDPRKGAEQNPGAQRAHLAVEWASRGAWEDSAAATGVARERAPR